MSLAILTLVVLGASAPVPRDDAPVSRDEARLRELEGREVRVRTQQGRTLEGVLTQVGPDGLSLRARDAFAFTQVPHPDVYQVQRRKHYALEGSLLGMLEGAFLGAAVGGAVRLHTCRGESPCPWGVASAKGAMIGLTGGMVFGAVAGRLVQRWHTHVERPRRR